MIRMSVLRQQTSQLPLIRTNLDCETELTAACAVRIVVPLIIIIIITVRLPIVIFLVLIRSHNSDDHE
jgi:hypothetical protein